MDSISISRNGTDIIGYLRNTVIDKNTVLKKSQKVLCKMVVKIDGNDGNNLTFEIEDDINLDLFSRLLKVFTIKILLFWAK